MPHVRICAGGGEQSPFLPRPEDRRQTVVVGGSTVPLSESFTYDADNRVLSSQVVGQSAKAYAYDLLGNLLSKAGVGSLTYGTGGIRPHAVTAAGAWTYTYDANGNRLQQKLGATVVGDIGYTSFNMPSTLMANGASMTLTYDANRERVKQTSSGGTLLYIGGPARVELEKSPPVGGVSTWTHTHYIEANGAFVAQRKWTGTHNGTVETKTAGPVDQYFHTDHLGSIAALTDASKAVLERFSHETWGKRRNASGWTDAATPPTSNHTTRGFTGHEELDLVGLVHMNGRVYDPLLGRFTSADPTIQFADNPQSYNRYSYVLNNPLSFTDPSGYGLFSFFKKLFKKIVRLVKKIFRVVKNMLRHPEMLAALAIGSITPGAWAALTHSMFGASGTFGATF